MKKKLFLLLLIVALAAFVFTGCTPHVDPEPEPEPGPEIEGVLVKFEKEYREDNRVYVAGGSNTVTVTFPAPVPAGTMVKVDLSDCTGDYSKGATYLFPVSEDRTVWEGSVKFECASYSTGPCADACIYAPEHCCATTVLVTSGACEDDTCIAFPVIVDCDKPFAKIEVGVKDCCCDECQIFLKSVPDEEGDECAACPATPKECCGDECSGLASYKVELYKVKNENHPSINTSDKPKNWDKDDNFGDCCELICAKEAAPLCEGNECPIDCVFPCIEDDEYEDYFYYAIATLKDNVGNTQKYYALIDLYQGEAGKCVVEVYEGLCKTEEIIKWHGIFGTYNIGTLKAGMYWFNANEKDGKYFIGECK